MREDILQTEEKDILLIEEKVDLTEIEVDITHIIEMIIGMVNIGASIRTTIEEAMDILIEKKDMDIVTMDTMIMIMGIMVIPMTDVVAMVTEEMTAEDLIAVIMIEKDTIHTIAEITIAINPSITIMVETIIHQIQITRIVF